MTCSLTALGRWIIILDRFFVDAASEYHSPVLACICSWNTLLSAALKQDQRGLFDRLEQSMMMRGVKGDVTTTNIKLQRALQDRPEEGLRLFEELREQHKIAIER